MFQQEHLILSWLLRTLWLPVSFLAACEAPEPPPYPCVLGDPASCTGGYVCHADPWPSRCGPPRDRGEQCRQDSECVPDPDIVCITTEGVCGELLAAGDRCARKAECGGHLDCQVAQDGDYRCVVVASNERCDDDLACPAPLVCRPPAEGLTRTCLSRAESGRWCSGDGDCLPGLVCGPPHDGYPAACGLPLGRSCDPNGGDLCVAGAGCYGGECRSKRTYSQSCEALDQCTPTPPYLATCTSGLDGSRTCTLPSGGLAPADGSLPCPPGHAAHPDEVGTTRCLMPGGPYYPCNPRLSGQCAAGLDCLSRGINGGGGWACLVAMRHECTDNPGACQEGAVCRPESVEAIPTRRCLEVGQVSDACLTDDHCARALVCSDTRKCKVRDGEACERDSDCLERRHCILRGDRPTCVAIGDNGDPCIWDDQCLSGFCAGRCNGIGKCDASPRGTDQPCSCPEDCQSWTCTDGICE